MTYGGNGDAHAYLARCRYYEPIRLPNGDPGFCMYDICDVPGYRVNRDYVQDIFGTANRVANAGKCHYRLGDCPVVLEGSYAKAKSMLFPGFRNTPERQLLESGEAHLNSSNGLKMRKIRRKTPKTFTKAHALWHF